MAVYPSPWGGRVSKLRSTTKRFQPTETVTNPNVCALDDALMAVLPLESALARARWPSEHPFGHPNGPTAIQIAKAIAHTIGFVTESQSRSLTLPDRVALSRAKTAKTRSQTVCCKNHQRSVRCERPQTPHHGPAVAQNAQHLGAPLGAPFDVVLLLFPICYMTLRSQATVQLSAHNCRLRITKMLRSKTAAPLF